MIAVHLLVARAKVVTMRTTATTTPFLLPEKEAKRLQNPLKQEKEKEPKRLQNPRKQEKEKEPKRLQNPRKQKEKEPKRLLLQNPRKQKEASVLMPL